jgi:ABC-type multidrug transport system fused ATPase/permease subunit
MRDGYRLAETLRAARWKLAFTYSLSGIESGFTLIYPWSIGYAIDGLLAGSVWAMAPLVGTWLAHTAIGAGRQMYDTRVFTGIYTDIACSAAGRQHEAGASTSQIAARVQMGREIVDFGETEVPSIITAVVTLFGALAMLAWYDLWFAGYALAVVVPAFFANRAFSRRAIKLNRAVNDQMEREVDVLTQADADGTQRHYRGLAALRVQLSDREARTWSLIEVLFVALTVAVLLRATLVLGLRAGEIFATMTYVFDFTGSLRSAPTVLHKITRLIDIRRRLEGG